jgi:hypothetical protein
MPDVLAIVSKQVFETAAKGLGPGDVWPTASYASAHAGLRPLAHGGRLVLVTVRPELRLWRVAVLDAPRASRGGWRAAVNTAPIADVTRLIPRIKFASGKGLVRDARLGMSLQSPRELTADAAALLLGAAATAPSKAAPRAAAGPARPPADVPEAAIWNAADDCWEHGALDERGCKQGPWRSWRADGTLLGEGAFVDHDLHGANRRYHPDGSLASEGQWVRGVMRAVRFFATPGPTDPPRLRQGGAATVRTDQLVDDAGVRVVTIRCFDADGRERDPLGVPVPPRPAGVPETARWFSDGSVPAPDGTSSGWVDGPTLRERDVRCGTWRWWSNAGEPLRAEIMGPYGRPLHTITPTDDELTREIDEYLAAPMERQFSLAMRWSPLLHARVRDRLAALPAALTREYVSVLHAHLEEPGHLGTREITRPREILEVVEDWERRAPPDARDVDAWFLLGAGARAAYELRDAERLARWWPRFTAVPRPKRLPDDTYAFNDFDDDLGKQGEVRARIEALRSGRAARAHAALAARLAAPRTFAAVPDAELADLVSARAGARPCEVLVRDPATCEAWLLDADGETHHWTPAGLAAPTVRFSGRPGDELVHLAQSDACDERRLYWPGKYGWLALQRYGRSVLWHAARYYPSRGQAEVERLAVFKAGSPVEARRMMDRIAGGKPGPVDPWEPPKLGPIFRIYRGEGIGSLAVRGKSLVTRGTTLETFPSREAAIVAFETIEIERIRSGGMIERFVAGAQRG